MRVDGRMDGLTDSRVRSHACVKSRVVTFAPASLLALGAKNSKVDCGRLRTFTHTRTERERERDAHACMRSACQTARIRRTTTACLTDERGRHGRPEPVCEATQGTAEHLRVDR
mmetsp:Transcript_12922/g.25273  ORF Transcript_12922/g.25273 Transcript_12922/m.25273 type:complete len:114 (-) Transcript_12922:123-464(-)